MGGVFEIVLRGQITEGSMQSLGVVLLNIPGNQGSGLLKLRKSRLSDAFGFQGFVRSIFPLLWG